MPAPRMVRLERRAAKWRCRVGEPNAGGSAVIRRNVGAVNEGRWKRESQLLVSRIARSRCYGEDIWKGRREGPIIALRCPCAPSRDRKATNPQCPQRNEVKTRALHQRYPLSYVRMVCAHRYQVRSPSPSRRLSRWQQKIRGYGQRNHGIREIKQMQRNEWR